MANVDSNVFLVANAQFGTGDPELGKLLMKVLLNTISENKDKPSKMIFMNDGVRLTTEGSQSLDSLQKLQDSGVEILSCGTCLDFYHVKDKLKVGKVTNMYDTVNTLVSSPRVVRL